jgi:hypothetical protein
MPLNVEKASLCATVVLYVSTRCGCVFLEKLMSLGLQDIDNASTSAATELV